MMVSGLLISGKFKIFAGVNTNRFSYSEFLDTHDSTVELYKTPDMTNRRQLERSQSVTNRSSEKPKAVLVYKNGDIHFKGYQVTLTPRRFRNFDNLLSELTRVTNLPQGARYVFTPTNGTRVNSLEQLHNGQKYVCDSHPRLKKVDYNKIPLKAGKTMVTKDFKSVSSGSSTSSSYLSQRHSVDGERQPVNLRPKMITAVRNGVSRPHTKVKLLLNKRTAHTLMQVLDDVTSAIGSDGCIRKLYNLDGKRIQQLSELFNEDTVYIAVGSERFRSFDIPEIRDELGVGELPDKSNSTTSLLSKNANSLKRKNSRPKGCDKNDETDISYPLFNMHADSRIRKHSEENDPITEIADLPVVKQYDHEHNFYLREGRAQLLNNIAYISNKDNIYIRNQRSSKVDSNVFNKKSMNRHRPLPSIDGSISHARRKIGDEGDKSRRRRRKKRISSTDSDSDCAQEQDISPSSRKNERFVLPIFKDDAEEYRQLIKDRQMEIKQPAIRNGTENKKSLNNDKDIINNNKNKNVRGSNTMKYQDKNTIKDIFNDIFNIDAHANNRGNYIVDNDYKMDKAYEDNSYHKGTNGKQGGEVEVRVANGTDKSGNQDIELNDAEDDVEVRTVDFNDVENGVESKDVENDEENNREVNVVEDNVGDNVKINDVKYGVDPNADSEVEVRGVEDGGVEVNLDGNNYVGENDVEVKRVDDNYVEDNDVKDNYVNYVEVISIQDNEVEVNDVNSNVDVDGAQDNYVQDNNINIDSVKDNYIETNHIKVIDVEDNGIAVNDAELDDVGNNYAEDNNFETNRIGSSYVQDNVVEVKDTEDNDTSDNRDIEFNDIGVVDAEVNGVDNTADEHDDVKDASIDTRHNNDDGIGSQSDDFAKYINAGKGLHERDSDREVQNDDFQDHIEDIGSFENGDKKIEECDHIKVTNNDVFKDSEDNQDNNKAIIDSETIKSGGDPRVVKNRTNSEPNIPSLGDMTTDENKTDAPISNNVNITNDNEGTALDQTDSEPIISSLSDMSADEIETDAPLLDSVDVTNDNKGVTTEETSRIVYPDHTQDEDTDDDEEDIVTYLNRTKNEENSMRDEVDKTTTMTISKDMSDIQEHGTVFLCKGNSVEKSHDDETAVEDKASSDSVEDIQSSGTVVISRDVDVLVDKQDSRNTSLSTTNTINENILNDDSVSNVHIKKAYVNNNSTGEGGLATNNEEINKSTSAIEYKENAKYEPPDNADDSEVRNYNDLVNAYNDSKLVNNHEDKNLIDSDNYNNLVNGYSNNDLINHHSQNDLVDDRNDLVDDRNDLADDRNEADGNNIPSNMYDLIHEQIPKRMSPVPDIHSENVINQLFSNEGINAFYEIGEILGDGNFAIVRRVMDLRTHMAYAMKIIDAPKILGKEELLYNEIRIQRECNHPNLVKLFHDFHSPTEIYLVMELVRGGDFFDYISENEKLEEIEASVYVRDLCSGIDYLHQRDIVHRDIKPENLLLCTSSIGEVMVKIADFGLARRITGPIYTVCGTPTYVAPEILTEQGYTNEVDIWAAGVILYIMLCGFPPFRSTKRQQSELFELIEAGEFEFLAPYWDDVSDLAKSLVSNMIVVKVRERFTAQEVLTHQWLRKYDLTRTDTTLDEPLEKRTFRTLGKGSLAIEKFSNLAKRERGESVTPDKGRRSRNGVT